VDIDKPIHRTAVHLTTDQPGVNVPAGWNAAAPLSFNGRSRCEQYQTRSSRMCRIGRFGGMILAFWIATHLTSQLVAAPQASSQKGSVQKTAGPAAGESQGKNDEAAKPAKRLTAAEKKEATIAEARLAVKEMVRKLSKGEYQDFMHQHFPIDEYVRRLRSGQPVDVPLRAIPQFIQIAATLGKLQDGDAKIDPTGRVVSFKAKDDAQTASVIESPYSKKPDDVPSYEGDLPKVIAAALKDLESKAYEDCMSRLIPPSTIHMMKTDGRWDGMIESLSPESPTIQAMVSDLTAIAGEKPSIDGDTAEYRQPRVIHVVGGRNQVQEKNAGERLIRFSKINGAWRFYDNNSTSLKELDAALRREVKGEFSEDQLVVEKIGSDWRLLQVPGMPRVRPLQ
jgi:hypothetical protein